jgi:GTP cyclohydrolase I
MIKRPKKKLSALKLSAVAVSKARTQIKLSKPSTPKASLPDPMNSKDKSLGAKVAIPFVGIQNVAVPFEVDLGKNQSTHSCVNFRVGVDLAADKRGINMSRILRELVDNSSKVLNIALMQKLASAIKSKLDASSVFLKAEFSFPLEIPSLRSEHSAKQYYKAAHEVRLEKNNKAALFTEVEFLYSSACPCSTELSKHALEERGVYGIPHSQRSKAIVKIQHTQKFNLSLNDLVQICRDALVTETQMIVRRIDEQAFAELNGVNQKFVEDAVRLLYQHLNADKRIQDFYVYCQHFESLHAHDAVACIRKGLKGGMIADCFSFS